jgi:DNA modification methylase
MTELVWAGKYLDGRRSAPVRIALPFQTVETVNESAQERQRVLDLLTTGQDPEWRNRLIWGDKKYVLPSLLPQFAGKVTLIYIDPPFDTSQDFSYLATVPDGSDTDEGEAASFVKEPSILELKAYRDTWGVSPEEKQRGISSLDKYIKWFYETVLFFQELLTDDGTLYVHLDWRMAHYAKCVIDEVFGEENFMCQIIWKRSSIRKAKSNKWLSVDDVLLVATKSERHKFNTIYLPYSEEYKKRFTYKDEHGSYYWIDIGTYSAERLERLKAEGRVRFPDNPSAHPRIKHYLHEGKGVQPDNVWTDIIQVNSQANEDTGYPTQKPEALLERIIAASSDEGDLVLDCFCGSGTTAVVAERLRRRWIACDLGRFAIHTTRKRLLGIPTVGPFMVQNLGKYERQAWQVAEFAAPDDLREREARYRQFILDLYHGSAINGHAWLHGVKHGRMVHVAAVDAPVTLADVKAIAAEVWRAVGRGEKAPKTAAVDVLGWEFAFELHELARQIAAEAKVDVAFKKIPREVLDKRAVEQGDIRFFELAALTVDAKVRKRDTVLTIKDFVLSPEDLPEEARRAIRHWSQCIDYWAVDWDYKGDTFHNQWQTYRTRKERSLATAAEHTYEKAGRYTILVKAIDILGNDTTKAIEVEVS